MQRDRSEERVLLDFEEVFEQIDDMITIHDKDFNIVRANRYAVKRLGLPPLNTAGIKCYRYYHGMERPPDKCPSCKCILSGIPATFDMFEPHLNASLRIKAVPILDEESQYVGSIHIVRDITTEEK
jgi:PAS domain-containing protein